MRATRALRRYHGSGALQPFTHATCVRLRLRVLWSRRALHTVSIFGTLKRGQAEPDATAAAALGAPALEGAEQVFNMAPQVGLLTTDEGHARCFPSARVSFSLCDACPLVA